MRYKGIKVDLILFDLDGTLVDSKRDIAVCVNLMLQQMGYAVRDEEQIYSFIGLGIERLIEDSMGTRDQDLIKKGLSVFRPLIRSHLLDTTTLYPHVRKTLEYFDGKDKAVISNRDKELTTILLRSLDIEKYFRVILGGDEIECRKPSPCPIEKVLRDTGVPERKAVMVGDMSYDVTSGKEAGIHTCAVTYGIGRKDDLAKTNPDFIINNLPELKEILR